MDQKQREENLTEVLDSMVEFYKQKLVAGELSAAEQKNLIQLLRDNKITVDPRQGDPLDSIVNGSLDDIDWEQYTE